MQIIRLFAQGHHSISGTEELVVRIDDMPQLREAVQIWRYKPWHAWTKPMLVERPQDIMEDDVQLLYWRDQDGLFGAAVPLSASGFRTTLGQMDGKLAARSAALAHAPVPADLPMIAVGYGPRAYEVVASTYRAALAVMDRTASSSRAKALPEELHYLGWNSWNASNLGRDLSSELMFSAAKTLRNAGVPVGWMTVDDGYFQHRDQLLLSFAPDPQKFPGGFHPMVERLKREFGIRYIGVWLALNGYWHGIAPEGQVGREFADDLFNWTEKQDPSKADSLLRTGTFVRPDRPAIQTYYEQHLGARKADGFDFVKVDNQLVVERMARGNFPVWQLASAMHEGLNEAAAKHFGNKVINCMDLTAEAYFNFGRTPVARAVEDYFPYEAGETYNYEKGNAAAHVGQALYNSIYVSQVAIPDLDMFETTNPNALMHAVARVANNGPIYITDQPGKHDIELIKSMALSDGRLLKADAPLLPTEDSLFVLQKPSAVKAFSRVGDAGLIAAFNFADADRVTGSIKAGDVPGFASAVAYEHVSGRLARLSPAKPIPLDLKRFGVELWTLHKPRNGFAAFGRTDKLNGVAAVKSVRSSARQAAVVLHEGGPLAAYVAKRPSGVVVDGTASNFSYSRGLLRVDAPATGSASTTTIRFG